MIHPVDNGFQEALAIVSDAKASAERHCRAFGYSLLWEGGSDAGMLAQLGLPGDTGREVLIGDPSQARGFIRFLELVGRDEGLMRDGAQPWDAGGIYDVNVRSLGPLEVMNRAMQKAGHVAFGPLTAWDFGPLSVKEVVLRDTDGLAFALMERVAPPLTGYEHVAGHASYVFNSTQLVADFDAARRFYVEGLGWGTVTETEMVHENGGLNCLGLPLDVARSTKMRIGIYQQNGLNEGSVELVSLACEGMDYSASRPPLRGWASLRFPVGDPAAVLAKAAAAGCEVTAVRTMRIEPYGAVEMGAATTPWGARLEFYRAA
ncbi:VOC family protein [Sandaracinobacteroides hominis]|uniref:VOC family protein n=1 Tax=Sandaracinobacteroides hominis TaxID=2780086 RepID=UPI0018F799C7|nr:VOC family protein [Sandaracinobacteroides hominis]